MSLNNMVVFRKWLQTTYIKVLNEQYSAFNEAVNNCLVLRNGNNHGDFEESDFYQPMPNMIRHRNPRDNNSLSDITFTMDKDRHVKVGRGGGPVVYDYTQFDWINRPDEAGMVIGKNFAKQKFRQEFDLMISIALAALSNHTSDIETDVTGLSQKNLSLAHMNTALSKFGDAYQQINTWFCNSKTMFDLWGQNIANAANLFDYSGVIVKRDPFGNTMIMTDTPSLVEAGTPNEYYCLGLTPGAVILEQNDDYRDASEEILGKTNIGVRWQGEWSFNVQVKGHRWDDQNGGACPNDAALLVNTNWDSLVNTHKELPGIILKVQ